MLLLTVKQTLKNKSNFEHFTVLTFYFFDFLFDLKHLIETCCLFTRHCGAELLAVD